MEKQGFGHTGARNLPDAELKWQIRINLSEQFAAVARVNPADPALTPLLAVVRKYDGHLKHQEMSFANFIPHFKDDEMPEHLNAIQTALDAVELEDATDDVEATLTALQNYKDAVARFIERYSELYLWTKRTMQMPSIQEKYAKRFTVYADGGQEVYSKDVADSLEADLQPLIAQGIVEKIDKFDSDPAHNPQAPSKFRMR